MRDHREEARLGAIGGFRLVARIGECALDLGAIGNVASDTLNLRSLGGADCGLAPGDPALAVGSRDFLVVRARSVGGERGVPLRDHGWRKVGAEKLLAAAGNKRAERIVGVGDAPAAVAPDDHVALRLEHARGALLGLLELPVAVREIFGALAQTPQFTPERAIACDQQADGAAGGAKQCRRADDTELQVVARRAACDRGEEGCCHYRYDDDSRERCNRTCAWSKWSAHRNAALHDPPSRQPSPSSANGAPPRPADVCWDAILPAELLRFPSIPRLRFMRR